MGPDTCRQLQASAPLRGARIQEMAGTAQRWLATHPETTKYE
jgi:hypothetical protein